MSLALLLPAGLAALVALALPLVIHIARASEARITDFAALRWLGEKPRPRHRIRFDEWLLLALRLILLALVALWLARPVLEGTGGSRPWVVAIPGVDAATARARAGDKARLHWLAPGFPTLDRAPPAAPLPVGSLLRELDATLPAGTPLTVLVPPILEGADAERPRLSRAVTWTIVPGRMATAVPPRPAPFRLALRYAPTETGLRYIRAAALALDANIGTAGKPLPPSGALIWFVPGPLPAEVRRHAEAGATVLAAANTAPGTGDRAIVLRDAAGAPLVESTALGAGRLLRFTRPLNPTALPELLDPAFASRIGALLRAPLPAPARVAARDYRPETGGLPPLRAVQEVQPWLALLIAALVLVERWFATSRRRGMIR